MLEGAAPDSFIAFDKGPCESWRGVNPPPGRFGNVNFCGGAVEIARPAPLQMPKLLEDRAAKLARITRISGIKTSRFLKKAEKPFDSGSAHPDGRALESVGEKIDRPADSNRDRHAKRTVMHEHPFFGFGAAERNEEQVGLRGANLLRNVLVVHFKQWIVGRGIVSTDVQAGVE